MASGDESSELSSLSALSSIASDDELGQLSDVEPKKSKKGILNYFSKKSEQPPKEPSPPPRKRSPSPPHEYVLADNPDIAFIVMFRSRFSEAFPKSLAHFGPQDLERDVVQTVPGDRVEHFLCALLGLLLNRKQDVKPGHYGRALEDAITSHKSQWARSWEDQNPLSGGKSFNTMDPTQRLTLLRTLILWTLSSSDAVKSLINQSYKQNRHEDDLNQPRSVQPWGTDGDKRRYFLIEGQDDTAFRVYRESNPAGTQRTWWSVAGSIEELKALAEKLETKDGGPKAKKFATKILMALPRFEAGEEKRKRREYRQTRKEQFKRPEPGFSMYEGRTRGKRVKYTYSDDEDISFSDSTTRRSARNTGTTTPAETAPVTTSSGRQIRAPSRLNVITGDSAPNSVRGDTPDFDQEDDIGAGNRPKRSGAMNSGSNGVGLGSRQAGSDDEVSEADFGDDEEDVDEHVPEESEDEDEYDEDETMVEDDLDDTPRSLVVKLSLTPPKLQTALDTPDESSNGLPNAPSSNSKAQVPNSPLIEMSDAKTPKQVASGASSTKESADSKKDGHAQAEEVAGVATTNRATTPDQAHRVTEKLSHASSNVSATSLAFRGSPEKLQDQASAPPLNASH